jgi:hypothetical protein
MFPKPEPTGEDKNDPKWGEMYDAYREWVAKEFGDDDGNNVRDFLDDPSSIGGSELPSNTGSSL